MDLHEEASSSSSSHMPKPSVRDQPESLPPHWRRGLTMLFQLATTLGIFFANLVSYGTQHIRGWGWRPSLHQQPSSSFHMPMGILGDQSPSGSSHHQDNQRTDPIRAETEPIFLSHSGKDKEFVNRLYRALRDAGHNPFMDTDSLPLGEHFPPRLIQTLQACKLGVVVLSPDFLTSKWPMRELHLLHTSPYSPKILPLFYKLPPDGLKKSSQWQKAWQGIAEEDVSIVTFSQLESAAVQLRKIQGIERHPWQREDDYIEEVVRGVSRIINPLLRYDVSHLTGHERLAKEVDEKFQSMRGIVHPKACVMIGFHGIGGLGKTTVCKLMVNKYASTYAGRCALIEFPTKDRNEKDVVNQCKKALNHLTNATIIDRLNDLDECVELMKEHMGSLDVFIALDNIWEECLDLAQRILDIGFSSNSQILVTSRSREVLRNLLKGKHNVMPLPSVSSEEAHQMFVRCFKRNQGGELVQLQDAQVNKLTGSYRSNGAYHPLGITALAGRLGRIAGGDQSWFAAWEQYSGDQSAATDVAVQKAIKINFDSLPLEIRNIFLVVTCIYMDMEMDSTYESITAAIWMHRLQLHVWLSAIYQEMTEWEIKRSLKELEYGGLLEFEQSGDVHVHDLYRDLATREACAGGNFLFLDRLNASARGNFLFLDCQNDDNIERGVIKISASKEPGATLVYSPNHTFLKGKHSVQIFDGIHLLCSAAAIRLLSSSAAEVKEYVCALESTSLRVLNLADHNWSVSLRHMRELSYLVLFWGTMHERLLYDDIPKLSKLSYLRLQQIKMEDDESGDRKSITYRLMCLDGLVNLQVLELQEIDGLQEISGLGSLVKLECMILGRLYSLRKVGEFSSCCTRLQVLQIKDCRRLTQVVGLASVLPNLKILGLPLLQLDQLSASHISSLQELSVFCVDQLEDLKVQSEEELQSEEKWEEELQSEEEPEQESEEQLQLEKEDFELQSGGGDFKLQSGEGYYFKVQIQGLPNLKALTISGDFVEEIVHICQLPSLETLYIEDVYALKRVDFSRFRDLGSLQEISISSCFSLKEVVEWSSLCDLPSLKEFSLTPWFSFTHPIGHVRAKSHLDFVELLGSHLQELYEGGFYKENRLRISCSNSNFDRLANEIPGNESSFDLMANEILRNESGFDWMADDSGCDWMTNFPSRTFSLEYETESE